LSNLSLRKISKRFGAVELFRGFDLDVGDGEFLCLLGPMIQPATARVARGE